jgi:hypothetical protein
MSRTAIVSTWLMGIALCSPALNAGETNAIPQRFHARIGGFKGPTYEVKLQDGRLEYARLDGDQHSRCLRVRPTIEQWTEFRRELDAIDIWRWRAQYLNPEVADGTQWSLDLAFADRAIKTQGSNEYPGPCPIPPAFLPPARRS